VRPARKPSNVSISAGLEQYNNVDIVSPADCYPADPQIHSLTFEYDENNVLSSKSLFSPGIDEPICMIDCEAGNAVYYYHFDGVGSVIALSDVNSVIVERYSYDVFGEPNTTSSLGNPYLFTGRRFDNETGLYYYRARYYDYYLGRFLQTDPIGYEDSMNLYTYVGNNPVVFFDPFGLCKDEDLPWYRKLALSITLPSVSAFYWGGGGAGHELIWIPGQGWRSYMYPQGGVSNPGAGINLGIGPVFNITSHEDYLRHYHNVQGTSPVTPYGSFGFDISWYKGSPTAVNFDWGASSGGLSYMRQYYMFTETVPDKIEGLTNDAKIFRLNSQHKSQIDQLIEEIESGRW